MHTRSWLLSLSAVLLLSGLACRESPPVADTPDASTEFPGGGASDGGANGGSDGGAEGDAGMLEDAGTGDGGMAQVCDDPLEGAPSECAYIDLMMWLVHCPGEGWSYPREWSDPSNMACPKFYDVGDSRCGTLEDLLLQEGCDTTCIRRPNQAVSFVHCGVRSDFVSFVHVDDDEQACPTMLKFDDGFWDTYEQWQADHPCP